MTSMPTIESDLAAPVSTTQPPRLKRVLLLTAGFAALVLAGVSRRALVDGWPVH